MIPMEYDDTWEQLTLNITPSSNVKNVNSQCLVKGDLVSIILTFVTAQEVSAASNMDFVIPNMPNCVSIGGVAYVGATSLIAAPLTTGSKGIRVRNTGVIPNNVDLGVYLRGFKS